MYVTRIDDPNDIIEMCPACGERLSSVDAILPGVWKAVCLGCPDVSIVVLSDSPVVKGILACFDDTNETQEPPFDINDDPEDLSDLVQGLEGIQHATSQGKLDAIILGGIVDGTPFSYLYEHHGDYGHLVFMLRRLEHSIMCDLDVSEDRAKREKRHAIS